jgi:ATP:cob(I)alamin adenosyltransferase
MVQLTRIYTKSGDKGKTSLGTGKRVKKHSQRIHCIGAVDEVNAAIGFIDQTSKEVSELLTTLQHDLFDVGGDLCFPEEDKPAGALAIKASYITRLERWIDTYNAALQPLNSFVLPGGSPASRKLHLARVVARRAERDLCDLADCEAVNPFILHYMNRLSDLLFVLARYENDRGHNDVLWQPGKNRE